ncbi:ABC transporter permease subunit [Epidermidibacterium keratini]|uniref:ABC transporter permease subunit n=1 Tax=Epidermidibacterium keratini TaxID=1891644 RepID=A0A7L4YQ31_9ACTN|nr:ABC transporter permease [Epidermidibacterium keratini]QHC01381.1 ABC transporter permease subunit [Epidermidibacterium keratini]
MSAPLSAPRFSWRLLLLRSWLPIMLVLVWWFVSDGRDSLYFPSLRTITETLTTDWLGPAFGSAFVPSATNFVVGFLIAGIAGIILGTAIGLSPVLRAMTEPLIQFVRSIPPPALLPFVLLIFGIGPTMSIAIIVIGAIWPTLLNTIDGVRGIDGQLLDVSRSYRLNFWRRLWYVVLPGASPQIFAGLRITLQMSIILIVVSEMVAATRGIGYYLLNSQQTFAVPQTWASTIVLGILGYIANLVFSVVEHRVLRWHNERNALTTKGSS